MKREIVGYYWDSKDFFMIEEYGNGKTRKVKIDPDCEEYKDFDDQVKEVRKMQKEIYG